MTATTIRTLIATEIARQRVERRLSARAAAVACKEAGWASIDRQRIANLEAQRGRPIGIDELLGLAWVFRTEPERLLLGSIDGNTADDTTASNQWDATLVELSPKVSLRRDAMVRWWTGYAMPWDDYRPPPTRRATLEEAMAAITEIAAEHGLEVTFRKPRRG